MKKILTYILSITLILGMASTAFAADIAYTDVKTTSWAYEAVKAMSDKEILKGYPDGSFKPLNTLTYGEFLKMTVLAQGISDPGNATGVWESTGEKKHWATEYYYTSTDKNKPSDRAPSKSWSAYGIKSSLLDEKISREHAAVIIGVIIGEKRDPSYEDLKAIIDDHDNLRENVRDITTETRNEYYIMKAYGAGILTGYEDGTFKPVGTLNRAEAATVVYRLADESKRVKPERGVKEVPAVSAGAVKGETGNVADIVKNYDSFTYVNTGEVDEFLRDAKTYTIITDPRPYRLELKENRGTKWLESTGLNLVYLMKDGNIVEYLNGNETYKTDITKADYIVSVKSSTHEMTLIPNPFKTK